MRNTSPRDTVLQDLKATQPCELLEFLIEKQVRKSRNAIKSLLAHKQIKVNGRIATQYNLELKAGDKVSVMKFDQSRKEKRLKGMKIVYEDKDLIIIDKESGLLSVSTDREKINTAYSILNEYVKKKDKNSRIFVVQRLDREVSGLLVFARSAELQEIFQKNWDNLVKANIYAGVVEGKPSPAKGSVKSWLTENKNFVMMSSAFDNGGLESVTDYKTVKSTGRYTLMDFELKTRRKNQLRVQMQSIGHPIAGDKKYGAKTNPAKRIALHVRELVLKHPSTGELLELKSTVPKAILQVMTPPAPKKEKPAMD
ncbi:RluA family pseudouridine synthase [Dysgonomonas sp. OttesenSCG-928-D17]|nr:RluA family pseudouridine synthase [Dysgonomonas sp. OttesenSCG-928-D17]